VSGLTLDATAQALRESLAGVLAQVKGYGDHQPAFRFHGGGMIRADTALGVLLGEFLIHGRDIAEALGRAWWIDRHDAALVIDAVQPILPGWVDPGGAKGLSATFDLRIRGAGAYTWTFEDGRLEVRPGSPLKADCRISADAPAFLLVMYRRQSQWRPIFRGRLAAWGRRPWLALNLADKFYKP